MDAPRDQLWKVADESEAASWAAQGSLGSGSALDQQDGFIHTSDARMVREVARRFFAGKAGLRLLRIGMRELGGTAPVMLTHETPTGTPDTLRIGTARAVVHCLPDGCAHIYHTADQPVPWSAITVFDLPLGADGEHIFPRECPMD